MDIDCHSPPKSSFLVIKNHTKLLPALIILQAKHLFQKPVVINKLTLEL